MITKLSIDLTTKSNKNGTHLFLTDQNTINKFMIIKKVGSLSYLKVHQKRTVKKLKSEISNWIERKNKQKLTKIKEI